MVFHSDTFALAQGKHEIDHNFLRMIVVFRWSPPEYVQVGRIFLSLRSLVPGLLQHVNPTFIIIESQLEITNHEGSQVNVENRRFTPSD